MNLSIKCFKPKTKGKSDKYSCQLYEFLRRHQQRFNGLPNVYYIQTQDRWNSELERTEQVEVLFDKQNFSRAHIWVGNIDGEGWYYGNKLSCIIGESKEKYTIFASLWYTDRTVIDITDWFWNEYLKVGRCIWDKSHNTWLMNDDDRFTYINKNSRRCNWCGQWQHREIEKRVKLERKSLWKVC